MQELLLVNRDGIEVLIQYLRDLRKTTGVSKGLLVNRRDLLRKKRKLKPVTATGR